MRRPSGGIPCLWSSSLSYPAPLECSRCSFADGHAGGHRDLQPPPQAHGLPLHICTVTGDKLVAFYEEAWELTAHTPY